MSVVSYDRTPSVSPLPIDVSSLFRVLRGIEWIWRKHRQAALLRCISGEIRADIGYSQDYIRADWEYLAVLYPDTIAPSEIVRSRSIQHHFAP